MKYILLIVLGIFFTESRALANIPPYEALMLDYKMNALNGFSLSYGMRAIDASPLNTSVETICFIKVHDALQCLQVDFGQSLPISIIADFDHALLLEFVGSEPTSWFEPSPLLTFTAGLLTFNAGHLESGNWLVVSDYVFSVGFESKI